ncbi:hypothetical protein ABID80_004301 [Streptomyces sp. PvP037]|uniref:hypothetical protein n=1 Tax=Streptomyces sp. PvP037 TaxID=3156437 RepID=UPI003394C09A
MATSSEGAYMVLRSVPGARRRRTRLLRGVASGGLALAGVLVAGCGAGAGAASEPEVRRDEKVIRRYFPEFGDFEEVVWAGETLGDDSRGSVPGPSDVRVSGVVRLAESDARRLRGAYEWRAAPDGPDVLPGIRPHVPGEADWLTSEGFTATVTGGRYPGAFHLDLRKKTLVFDARNPTKKKT